MNKLRAVFFGGVLTVLAGAAIAEIAKKPSPPAMPLGTAGGYLGKAAPDTYKILPAAPTPGTIRWESDRATFLATRRLKDTPRWAMAVKDVDLGGAVRGLSCAVGVELNPTNAPRFSAMVARLGPDVAWATNNPKDIYKRPRPYITDPGPTCVEQSPALSASPDYPSGHVTYGWTIGLILAELAPDRATDILVRARAYGESRLVCGVHSMSAVESGRSNASILVAGLHGSETFRKDLEAARTEVAKARLSGPAPDPAVCAAEAETTKVPLYN